METRASFPLLIGVDRKEEKPVSNLKLLRTILRLKSLKITDFRFLQRGTELHLAVKPYKNGCRCPECGRRGRIVHQPAEPRRWEDVAVLGLRLVLWYAPKEIRCPTHGRVQEEIPWAPASARVTYRLEWRLCALCQVMTQTAAAEILRLPTSTLSNLLHRVITRVRDGHTIRGLTTLGVDEVSYCKGRKFATLVYDLDRARVLWVGPGKGRDTIDRFFHECLSRGQKARVAWASCDMSPAYIGAITHHCPNVTLVIDRFHLVKALESGRGRGPEGTVAGARHAGAQGDQRPAVVAQHPLPTSDPGPHPIPQSPAKLQPAHPPGRTATTRSAFATSMPTTGPGVVIRVPPPDGPDDLAQPCGCGVVPTQLLGLESSDGQRSRYRSVWVTIGKSSCCPSPSVSSPL